MATDKKLNEADASTKIDSLLEVENTTMNRITPKELNGILLGGGTVTDPADLDTFKTSGVFWVGRATPLPTGINSCGTLVVLGKLNTQIYIPYYYPYFLIRTTKNEGWGDWAKYTEEKAS